MFCLFVYAHFLNNLFQTYLKNIDGSSSSGFKPSHTVNAFEISFCTLIRAAYIQNKHSGTSVQFPRTPLSCTAVSYTHLDVYKRQPLLCVPVLRGLPFFFLFDGAHWHTAFCNLVAVIVGRVYVILTGVDQWTLSVLNSHNISKCTIDSSLCSHGPAHTVV